MVWDHEGFFKNIFDWRKKKDRMKKLKRKTRIQEKKRKKKDKMNEILDNLELLTSKLLK